MRGMFSAIAMFVGIVVLMPHVTTAEPLAGALGGVKVQEIKLKYPDTKKVDLFEDYHGTKVADPYRWLEDDVRKSKDVAHWVEAENKVTEDFLVAIPERNAIKERITDLWNYEKFTAPFKAGVKYLFYKNNGLQNQSVLYNQDALDAEPRVLLDPNTWSKGRYCCAGRDCGDGRWQVSGVRESSGRIGLEHLARSGCGNGKTAVGRTSVGEI